jgi:pimeloyl-ACP methyl ester carboxylesterase
MMTAKISHTYVPGRSPCIVFVHGLGADGRCFEPSLRSQCGDNAILIPDLMGFGKTDSVPGGFSFAMQAQADQVLLLCASKGLHDIAIVGHSMGGAVGIFVAERWIGKVTHFANAVGNLVPEDCTYSRRIISQGHDLFCSEGFERFKTEIAKSRNPDRPAGTYLESLQSTTAHAMYRSSQDLVALSDNGELLSRFLRLRCKKLYLKDEDTPIPARLQRALVGANIAIVEVPKSGHGLMEDNPDAFYGAIDSWLKEKT